ncbi:MAG: TspO/MBR family protein [Bacillota bacterium]|nr:TspO/MBR family protein [Bacillota bacterium]
MVCSKKRVNCIAVCTAAVALAAVAGALFTDAGGSWYAELKKPVFTPPPLVFGIVWTSVYLCLAASASLVCCSEAPQKRKTLLIYGLNLAFNALWSYVFFQKQNIVSALIVLALVIATLAVMLIFAAKINRAAAYLLLPYLVWSAFAFVLNYSLAMLN